MSSVENVMTNDDLDELTAMLQSLDEPVKKPHRLKILMILTICCSASMLA
ncbi:hypothetical protein AB2F34_24250 (plasmid) [Escherichia coli]